MPKVSVIIPVYNTERYLQRCLNCIVGQTIEDIEIICINDASTDASLSILQKYAKKDRRIVLINMERQYGAASARNAALSRATGEYIGFVDSDDYIDIHYFESLYCAAINDHADIAKCNRKTVEIDGSIGLMEHNSMIKADKFFFFKGFTTAIYSTAMIRKNNIKFPDGLSNHEDVVFLVKAVYWANRVTTVDNAWYYCEKRPDSSSHGIDFEKRISSNVNAACMIIEFLNSTNIDLKSYLHIFHEEFMSIYRQGKARNDPTTATYCLQLLDLCKYKENFLAQLTPKLALALKNNDTTDLTEFYNPSDTKQMYTPKYTPKMTDFLRLKVRNRLP